MSINYSKRFELIIIQLVLTNVCIGYCCNIITCAFNSTDNYSYERTIKEKKIKLANKSIINKSKIYLLPTSFVHT